MGELIPVVAIIFGCLMVTAIVVVGNITKMKARSATHNGHVTKDVMELEDRLDRLEERYEKRIANLETIILEQDKERRFDKAL